MLSSRNEANEKWPRTNGLEREGRDGVDVDSKSDSIFAERKETRDLVAEIGQFVQPDSTLPRGRPGRRST